MEMLIVGELRDKNMIEKMSTELTNMGIVNHINYNQQIDIYFLTVEKESDLAPAQDYYRVKLGFGKAMQPDPEWSKIKTLPRGELTFKVIIFCTVLFILGFTEMGKVLTDLFFISKPESNFLQEVLRGQVWRLVTPIFIHLSIMHIVFNMLWFKDLGYIIEYKFGRNELIVLMLVSGVISNLLQYCVNGPQFGGMSGVLYAMLGFVWVYKSLHNDFDYSLPTKDIMIMLGWLLLCLTGLVGPVANAAHAGGLFVGMLFGVYRAPMKWGRLHFKYISLAFLFLAFTIGVEGIKLGGRYFILLWI